MKSSWLVLLPALANLRTDSNPKLPFLKMTMAQSTVKRPWPCLATGISNSRTSLASLSSPAKMYLHWQSYVCLLVRQTQITDIPLGIHRRARSGRQHSYASMNCCPGRRATELPCLGPRAVLPRMANGQLNGPMILPATEHSVLENGNPDNCLELS